MTTNLEPDAPYEENGVLLENVVVGVSSLLAFDGRPKSSCNIQDEDAQGDGSSDDGIEDEYDDEEEGEVEKASETNNPELSIAMNSTIIGTENGP